MIIWNRDFIWTTCASQSKPGTPRKMEKQIENKSNDNSNNKKNNNDYCNQSSEKNEQKPKTSLCVASAVHSSTIVEY